MKIRNQGGFSAVEGLLIFIIVAIIAGTGWYVMSANNKTNDTLNNAGLGTAAKATKKKQTNPAPVVQADPTASWTAYSNKIEQYSLKYPSTWVKAAKPSGCDLEDDFFMLGANSASAGKYCVDGPKALGQIHVATSKGDFRNGCCLDSSTYPNLTKEKAVVDGVVGEKQTGNYKLPADAIGAEPEDGHKTVAYIFYTNGITYQIFYEANSGYPDVLSDFNLMVTKTLKFSAN
jgi:hypothetical protein